MKKKNNKTKRSKRNIEKKRVVNNKHRDRLFKKLFGAEENKTNMLSLYNALNGSTYTDEAQLQIYTIEDVVYLGMKNDVGYILDSYISLYEHQSTYNPNMPLRGLLYFAKMYEKYIAQYKLEIYSSALKKIPTPQFYVFYNGEKLLKDKEVLKLSDAFIQPVKEGIFEWTAIMLNINKGHNTDLLEKCETLNYYATFIDKIKEFLSEGHSIEDAVTSAVNWCIDNGILSEYFKMHKSEVVGMVLTEYNEKQVMEDIKKEAYNDGFNDGRQEVQSELEHVRQRAENAETELSKANAYIKTLEEKLALNN